MSSKIDDAYYSGSMICDNCGEVATMTIAKGIPISAVKERLTCKACGCLLNGDVSAAGRKQISAMDGENAGPPAKPNPKAINYMEQPNPMQEGKDGDKED